MKRKFLLLITAIVSSALIFPQTSIALDSSSNAVDVGFRKVLDEYSNSLEWSYSTFIPSLTTASWMNANSNYYYMKHYTNSFTSLANVWDAWEGSLLYVDWKSDGKIDHTMIVVGVVVKDNKANPVIDQKSNNRHQITLTQSLKYAHKYYNNMTWYGLQYRYN